MRHVHCAVCVSVGAIARRSGGSNERTLEKSIKCADMQPSLICLVVGVPADEKFDRPDSGRVSDWSNIIRMKKVKTL